MEPPPGWDIMLRCRSAVANTGASESAGAPEREDPPMLIFKALHILLMFSVVTMEIGAEFLYAFAISRRDVRGLAAIHRILEQARLGPISVLVRSSR